MSESKRDYYQTFEYKHMLYRSVVKCNQLMYLITYWVITGNFMLPKSKLSKEKFDNLRALNQIK